MDSHCRLAERPTSRTAGSPLRNKSGVHCVVRLPIRVRVDRVWRRVFAKESSRRVSLFVCMLLFYSFRFGYDGQSVGFVSPNHKQIQPLSEVV